MIYLINDNNGHFFKSGEIVVFARTGVICNWYTNGRDTRPVSIERLEYIGEI